MKCLPRFPSHSLYSLILIGTLCFGWISCSAPTEQATKTVPRNPLSILESNAAEAQKLDNLLNWLEVYSRSTHQDSVIFIASKSAQIAKNAQDPEGVIRANFFQFDALFNLRKYKEALETVDGIFNQPSLKRYPKFYNKAKRLRYKVLLNQDVEQVSLMELENHLDSIKTTRDSVEIFWAHDLLAKHYSQNWDYQSAQKIIVDGGRFINSFDHSLHAYYHATLGQLNLFGFNHDVAFTHYKKGINHAQKGDNLMSLNACMEGLMRLHLISDNIELCRKKWFETENLVNKLGIPHNFLTSKQILAFTFLREGELAEERGDSLAAFGELYPRSMKEYRKNVNEGKVTSPVLTAMYYLNYGYLLMKLNHLDSADKFVEDCFNLQIASSSTEIQGVLYLIEGEILNKRGKAKEAIKNLKIGIDYYEKNYDPYQLEEGYFELSISHEQLGNSTKALEAYKNYLKAKFVRLETRNRLRMVNQQISDSLEKVIARENQLYNLQLANQETQLVKQKNQRNLVGAGMLLFFLLAGGSISRYQVLKKKNKLIDLERRKSDELLLNILPSQTANELKATGKARVQNFNVVTVLFADIKDFTKIGDQFSAEELVNELNHCFSAFDNMLAKYQVEKIKTVGDAYICASGLPNPCANSALEIAKLALDFQAFMQQYKSHRQQEQKPFFEIRIGIHTGPVVAGIVGVKKFAYDIWGDTVNVAARMEQNCEVGKINVSETSYKLIHDKFDFLHRGEIEVKGKGKMAMYFLT